MMEQKTAKIHMLMETYASLSSVKFSAKLKLAMKPYTDTPIPMNPMI
jgi:hypothetical protein